MMIYISRSFAGFAILTLSCALSTSHQFAEQWQDVHEPSNLSYPTHTGWSQQVLTGFNLSSALLSSNVPSLIDSKEFRQPAFDTQFETIRFNFQRTIINECGKLKALIQRFGANGAIEVTAPKFWHAIAEIVGEAAFAGDSADIVVFDALPYLGYLGYVVSHHWIGMGIYHGAIWQYLYLATPLPFWQVLKITCPRQHSGRVSVSLIYHCLHGAGHGAVLRAVPLLTDVHHSLSCTHDSTPPISPAVSLAALSICEQAPTLGLAFGCSQGMFHSIIEHHGSPLVGDPLYPCNLYNRTAAYCFFWLFASGMGPMPTGSYFSRSRWYQLISAPGHISSLCLAHHMPTRSTTSSCIFGLSAALFPLWHVSTYAPFTGPIEGETRHDNCNAIPAVSTEGAFAGGKVLCPLLWAAHKSPPRQLSAFSLVEWCRPFWPDHVLSCVVGSMYWVVRTVFPLKNTRKLICSQLRHYRGWNDSVMAAAFDLCLRADSYSSTSVTWLTYDPPERKVVQI